MQPLRWLLRLSLVLLVISLLSWRKSEYFSGGLDPVVVAKALIEFAAFLAAVLLFTRTDLRRWIKGRTAAVTISYLMVGLVGGMATGNLFSNLVLAVRVALILATMGCLVIATTMSTLIEGVATGTAAVGGVLALSGLSNVAHGQRLSGGVLPVNPNQMALLFTPLVLLVFWRMLNSSARRGGPGSSDGVPGPHLAHRLAYWIDRPGRGHGVHPGYGTSPAGRSGDRLRPFGAGDLLCPLSLAARQRLFQPRRQPEHEHAELTHDRLAGSTLGSHRFLAALVRRRALGQTGRRLGHVLELPGARQQLVVRLRPDGPSWRPAPSELGRDDIRRCCTSRPYRSLLVARRSPRSSTAS